MKKLGLGLVLGTSTTAIETQEKFPRDGTQLRIFKHKNII